MASLSILIAARNEIYLEKTIRNILDNVGEGTEIIIVLDGYIPDPQIVTNDNRVRFVHNITSIGQRQAINQAAELSNAKYIMKLDAHCAIDKDLDIKLISNCEYDWTVVPRMYNLDINTWLPKINKRTDYMYIGNTKNRELRAEYYTGEEYWKQHHKIELIDDTMCCMGPGFFMHRERFLELGGMDCKHGGWGQMGVEVGLKAWLSGGALKVNKNTWFAHWFRGDQGFPYPLSGNDVNIARNYSKDLWLNNKWPLQQRKLQWVVDKFNPPGWNNDLTLLYYTANVIAKGIEYSVLRSLKRHGYPIVSVSQQPMDLGHNIVVPVKRSLQNIYQQVLIGAKAATTEYVALCEDDCMYVAEHFKYRPKAPFGYNLNRWLLHLDKEIYSYRKRPILSQCIAHRETLIKNLEERSKIEDVPERIGEMGLCEKKIGMTEYPYETFETPTPNLVICHNKNTSGRKLLGKDAEPCKEIPVWGKVEYWIDKFKRRENW